MRFSAKIVGIAALLAVTGCSTISKYNPFSSKSESKHPPAELHEFKPSMAVKQAWSTSVGSAGAYVFAPAQAGEFVYAAGADGTLVKLEAAQIAAMIQITFIFITRLIKTWHTISKNKSS